MRLKRPEITENYQLEVIECESQSVQDIVNGGILALLVIGPIALFFPSPI